MDLPGTSSGHQTPSGSKYELQNSVSELFRLLNVCEGKHFSRETIADRFERNIGRQSSKPFSLFYNRLANEAQFVEKYQAIKCQNINEVDPFVRLLFRIREDKNMQNFLNQCSDLNKHPSTSRSSNSRHSLKPSHLDLISNSNFNSENPNLPLSPSSRHRKSAKHRSSSASSNMLSNFKHAQFHSKSPLKLNNKELNVPNLDSPTSAITTGFNNEPKLLEELNDSFRSLQTVNNSSVNQIEQQHNTSASSSTTQHTKKIPSYLSRDFHPCDWPKENDCFNTIGTHTVTEQEQLLLRDLLFVLIGIEGRYIRLIKPNDSSRYKLVLDSTADHFLAVTTNRILKISYCYSAIITFVESRVYGLVNQALVSSIQQHLYDYNMLVCQMEEMLLKNDLFLQKMFFMLLPYFSTFSLLRDLAQKLYKNKSVGGAVLTMLHEKTKSIQGMDNNALELCLTLTKTASIPYFDILKTWLYYGEIDDPRKEFFIEDTHNQTTGLGNGISGPHNEEIDSDDEYDDDFGKFNDKYWDLRYRINSAKTPIFLKKHEQIIYKTGKYVSIINKVKQLFIKSSKVPPLPLTTNCNTNASISSEPARSQFNSSSPWATNERLLPHIAESSFISNVTNTSSSSSSNASNLSAAFAAAAIFTPKPEEIQYSFDDSSYISPIISAYEEASSQLLHILINESQLVETFNAVKHYMLLSMGDFIVHFMKFASKDLCKRTDSVVQHRLDSMMGMALGISVCHNDRQFLKDDPHVEFVGKSFLKQIHKIMIPFESIGSSFSKDPSPSSSYLLRCDEEYEEEEDGDINLNRSIISSAIENVSASEGLIEVDSVGKLRNKYINSGKSASSVLETVDGNSLSGSSGGRNKVQKPNPPSPNKLFCYESLMLKFDVPFPLSLIFTQKSIVCYQLLFRYVFLCRYAEMELEETWKDNILNVQLKKCESLQLINSGEAPESPSDSETTRLLAKAFKSIHKKAFALRYKMIAFVRNFHYFYAFEVIDPSFAQFISQITRKGSSLDSVIECHEKFLEHCFSSCFLTSMEITSIIIKIFILCIELSHALKDSIDLEDQTSMMESSCFFKPNSNQSSAPNGAKKSPVTETCVDGDVQSQSPFEPHIHEKLNKLYFSNRHFGKSVRTVKEIIEKANCNFDSLVSKLLKKIYSDNCEYHMMYPFVARLDYNDFYRSKIER